MPREIESDLHVEFVACPADHAEAWRAGARILWGIMDRAAQENESIQSEKENSNDHVE